MRTWYFPLILAGFLVGCRPAQNAKPNVTTLPEADKQQAVRDNALQMIGQASESSQFRDALHLLTASFLNEPNVAHDVVQLSTQQANFLRTQMHLTDDEMAEVESGVFRPMDSHYLEGCSLLRDAARQLEKTNLPPLDLIRLAQNWVCRQVLLGSPKGNSWLPFPALLRSGFGSPSDRALVFLALLRQLQTPELEQRQGLNRIEGCVRDSPHPLVAVVIPSDPKKLYLFDMVLGWPVPGPNGIATLAEARQDPSLLKAAGIPETAIKDSEIYLNCPLTALAPRMKVLEEVLKDQDRIALYMDAAKVHETIAGLAGAPVRPGNPAGDTLRNSPTRSLRWFLPAEEGGREFSPKDRQRTEVMLRWLQFQQALRRRPQLTLNLYALKLMDDRSSYLPREAGETLLNEASDIMLKFSVQPRDMLLRGQSTALFKRLDRISRPLEEFELMDTNEFQVELNGWRRQAVDAFLAQRKKDRSASAKMTALWQDPYFNALVDLNTEMSTKKLEQGDPFGGDQGEKKNRKLITRLIFAGCKDALDMSVSFQWATAFHDKAEALQAVANSLKTDGPARQTAQQKALAGWRNPHGYWNKFAERYVMSPANVSDRIGQLRRTVAQTERFDPGYLPAVLHDWSTCCHARLFLADAMQYEGQVRAARAILDNLAQDLDAMAKDADLAGNIDAYVKMAQSFPLVFEQQRLVAEEFRGATLSHLRKIVEVRRKYWGILGRITASHGSLTTAFSKSYSAQ
jgi:hypothetical protein